MGIIARSALTLFTIMLLFVCVASAQKRMILGGTASGVHGAGGLVFKLSKVNRAWTESVLYTFDNPGSGSYADLIRDPAGNLYGTTEFGGPQFSGNVF